MSEIYRKVTPYEFNYVCDECNNGMLMATGPKDPETNKYPHKCVICGAKYQLSKSYPYVEYYGEGEDSDLV